LQINGTQNSWLTHSDGLQLKGILKTTDGRSLMLTGDRVLESFGNYEYDGSSVQGVLGMQVDTPAEVSPVCRSISIISNNPGLNQKVYFNNATSTKVTNATTTSELGETLWSADDAVFAAAPMRSTRHLQAARTDDINLEIGIEGSGAKLTNINVEIKGKGTRRP
jgi:hypothetical protein